MFLTLRIAYFLHFQVYGPTSSYSLDIKLHSHMSHSILFEGYVTTRLHKIIACVGNVDENHSKVWN